jgi:hypothetical protein
MGPDDGVPPGISGGQVSGPDVLEGGHEPDGWAPGQRPALAPLLHDLARAHPALTGALLAVVVLVGATVGVLKLRGPAPPDLGSVTAAPANVDESQQPLFQIDRPGPSSSGAGVHLSLPTLLADPARRGDSPQTLPLRIEGPGIERSSAFPSITLGPIPTQVEFSGDVDCDQVQLPVDVSKYSLVLRSVEAQQSVDVRVPLGGSAALFDRAVTSGCSSWLAARDLAVTRVVATVDPVRPHVDLKLLVENSGTRDAVLWTPDPTGSGTQVTSVIASIHGGAVFELSVAVDLATCQVWPDPQTEILGTDVPVGLRGAVGLDSRPAAGLGDGPLDPPYGVRFTSEASQAIRQALVTACGGIATPVILSPATGGATYDPKTQMLTAQIDVDMPPRIPMSLQLGASDVEGAPKPVPAQTGWLTPDASGQVRTTLRFSMPRDALCFEGGPYLVLALTARVPEGSVVRTVHFELSAQTYLSESQRTAACAP